MGPKDESSGGGIDDGSSCDSSSAPGSAVEVVPSKEDYLSSMPELIDGDSSDEAGSLSKCKRTTANKMGGGWMDKDVAKSEHSETKATEETAAMTDETTTRNDNGSTQSFTFEIDLPPPADVSPLGGNESVIAAMMARSVDRALEMSPAPPFAEETNNSRASSSDTNSRNRHNGHRQQRRSERHLPLRSSPQQERRKRSRSTNPARSSRELRKNSNHTSSSTSDRSLESARRRDRHGHHHNSHSHHHHRDGHHHHRHHGRDHDDGERRRRQRSTSEQPTARQRSRSRDVSGKVSSSFASSSSRSKSRDAASRSHGSRSSSRTRPSSSRNLSGSSEGSSRGGHRTTSHHARASMLQISTIREEEQEVSDSGKRSDKAKQLSRSRSKSRPRSPSRHEGHSKSRPSSPEDKRNRSRSRRRSPSKTRSGAESRQRSPSIRRSPSKPGQKSPSKTRQSQRSPSRSRKRSPSKTRQRSPSRSRREGGRSMSRTRQPSSSSGGGTDGVLIQPVLKPIQLKSSGPSFLSRLEESQDAAMKGSKEEFVGDDGLGEDSAPLAAPKSIRWGDEEKRSPQPVQGKSERGMNLVLEADMEEQDDKTKKEDGSQRRARTRDERRQMRNKSRRQKESSSGGDNGKQKQRTPKWSDLQDSISNLNLSKSSFDFDIGESGEFDDAKGQCVSVMPKITPVVFRSSVKVDPKAFIGAISPGAATPSERSHRGISDGGRWAATPKVSNRQSSTEGESSVEKMISDAKERAKESRERQARLLSPTGGTGQQQPSPQRGVHASQSQLDGVDGQKDPLNAIERLRKANALILEKKKRREDSKARQQHLLSMETSPQVTGSLTRMVSFVKRGDQNTAAQFAPSLHSSSDSFQAGDSWTEAGSSKSFGEDTAVDAATDDTEGKPNSARLIALKKGMAFVSKSGRNLMSIASGEEQPPAQSEVERNSTGLLLNAEKPKRRGKRADHDPKAGSTREERNSRKSRSTRTDLKKSSKWSDLKKGLDSMKKPKRSTDQKPAPVDDNSVAPRPSSPGKPKSRIFGSQRHTRTLDDEIATAGPATESSKRAAASITGRSKWSGLKGGMHFINKMKKATEAGKN